MGSENLSFFSQNDFTGGIETRQEQLRSNQLLDAQNLWNPSGTVEQRPGSSTSIYTSWLGAGTSGAQTVTAVVWTNSSTGVNTSLNPVNTVLTPVNYGDVLTFQSTPTGATTLPTKVLFNMFAANSVAKTRLMFEVWTDVGWRPVFASGTTGVFPSSSAPAPIAFSSGTLWQIYAPFPANLQATTLTFPGVGDLTGHFFRAWVRSATDLTGSPFTAGTAISSTVLVRADRTRSNQVNTAAVIYTAGAYLLKYASGNLVVSLGQLPGVNGGLSQNLPNIQLNVQGSLDLSSLLSGTNRYSPDYGVVKVPPATAVLPEFNTAFVAFANTVFEVPYAGPYTQTDTYVIPSAATLTGPLTATTNTDPLIVGPISISNPAVPYSTDLIPQLTSFPAANLIVYFKDRLWAAGISGDPSTIRWSGSATLGAYNVWPAVSSAPLSTAKDNSEITAISPLGDNLVVFKKNSIWQMIDNGVSDVGPQIQIFEPRLVVAGVGCVAPASVQAVQGGLIFLAEDGFYFYNGTPNIKRLSMPIQRFIDGLNPARMPFAVATFWRTKSAYLCACSTQQESQKNDIVFIFDYDDNAWWIWDGYDVQCWYQQDGVGLQEEIFALDSFGRAYQLGKWTQTDNGAFIDSWALTGRFGFTDAYTKTSRELRARGINNNPEVTYQIIGDDIEILNDNATSTSDVKTYSLTMPREAEAQYASIPAPAYGSAIGVPERRRERHSPNRTTAGWFQVKIYKMLKLFGLDLGFEKESRR